MKSTRIAFRVWLLVSLCVGVVFAGSRIPSFDDGGLAQGKYSTMHMLLEKTVMKVDVLTVDVRLGKKAHGEVSKLAAGKGYSEGLGNQIANVAIKADDAVVQLTFKRSVPLNTWINAVRENLQQARAAGLISAALEQKVSNGLPNWFAVLKDRGFKSGDKVLYRVYPDKLITAVVSHDGLPLVYRADSDKEGRGVVMASYFAPGSDFRVPLLQSLFK
jgi:hypothetical protein